MPNTLLYIIRVPLPLKYELLLLLFNSFFLQLYDILPILWVTTIGTNMVAERTVSFLLYSDPFRRLLILLHNGTFEIGYTQFLTAIKFFGIHCFQLIKYLTFSHYICFLAVFFMQSK